MYLLFDSVRMVQKIVTNSGTPFAVAPSTNHTDGTWAPYHLYDGEIGINSAIPQFAVRISGTIYYLPLASSSGAVFPNYANQALSNLTATSINASLVPQVNIDLGSTSNLYRNIYSSGSVIIGVGTPVSSGSYLLQVFNGNPPAVAGIISGWVGYSEVFGGGDCPHFLTSNGKTIKLYESTSIAALTDVTALLVSHGFLSSGTAALVAQGSEGGTGITTWNLGDIMYGSAVTNVPTKLAGNTVATKKVLMSLGAAGVATAPSWQEIPAGVLSCAMGSGNTLPLSSTQYAQFFFGQSVGTNEAVRGLSIPFACRIKNLYVRTSTAQSGTGNIVITIRKNAAATAVTLTIAAGAAAGTFTDLVNEVSFAAGDKIAVELINNATATSANILEITCAMVF